MRTAATAGHVDHGKSTLVLALTGTDPDRLAAEKERGLTIDLGFAFTALPSQAELMYFPTVRGNSKGEVIEVIRGGEAGKPADAAGGK